MPFGEESLSETEARIIREWINAGAPGPKGRKESLAASFSETAESHWAFQPPVRHELHAAETDRSMYGLLTDLKSRGLLDETLVVWAGEFGRTPTSQNSIGRDHSPRGFTTWMAGGGVKGGQVIGATDEFGYAAVENKVHVHDLHASILHLMGLDHTKLTYFHAGRNMRLTDVHGKLIDGLAN